MPFANKLLVYGERFILYEKGDTSNPLLTDNNMIIGCVYNKMLNNIITFSSKTIKFWNIFTGKLEKIYNDLVILSEITAYSIDDDFKLFYLGDSNGKIKSFYLSSGEFLKEFDSHKEEVSFIFHTKKFNFLITCSKDLCIKFHKLNDSNMNSTLVEIFPLKENGSPFQDKNLLCNIYVNEEKGLLLLSLTNGWIIDYDIEHFKFISNLNPNYSESIRNTRISNVLDIKEFDIIFVALENGDKYFLLKECSKFFNQYNIYTFGKFIEKSNATSISDFDDDNNNQKDQINIVICSVYCHEESKLFTGDHLGFLSCYDLSNFKNIFEQNYDKNEIYNILNNININLIYKKKTHKESITFIDIPFGLKPKIIFTISTDRILHLVDYYTGEYIDSLKVMSFKFEPIPIAIKYYKQNPFISNKNNKLKVLSNNLENTEKVKKEKEEEKEIFNYIKKYTENTLNKEDKEPINVVFRYFFEQNKKLKKPKLSYETQEKNGEIETINYAYDLINYEIKNKFNNKINDQKLLPYRSTTWNYNIDINNMINDGYNDLYKIKEKIKNLEEEIRETEKCFEKISMNNKNYFPGYIKNLKQEEKEQINEIIYNKINTFNLAVTRKNTMKKEIQNILSKSEKNNQNQIINITIENELNNYNKNREKTLLTTGNKKINKIKNYLPAIKNDKTKTDRSETPILIKSINNNLENKKINKITLRKKEENNNSNLKSNRYKFDKIKELKTINLSKDLIDKRFLGYKNEFYEKYNEFKRPFEILLSKNGKNYSKMSNKLSFNNININKIKNEV